MRSGLQIETFGVLEQSLSDMFARLLRLLLVLSLALNATGSPWAVASDVHTHGLPASAESTAAAGHMSSGMHAVHAKHESMSPHHGSHGGHDHSEHPVSDGASLMGAGSDADAHAEQHAATSCCDASDCGCGCTLPLAVAITHLRVPSLAPAATNGSGAFVKRTPSRHAPPLRPPIV